MSTDVALKDVVCEFLEVAIHNVLYARKLYPDTIFERKRIYGVVVHQSIHPEINDYITECVKSIQYHLRQNQLRAVYLLFSTSEPQEKILEKHYFEIINFQIDTNSDRFLVTLEQFLRDYCLKIDSSCNYLPRLPENAIFSIQLCVTEYSNVDFNQQPSHEAFPFVLVKEAETKIADSEIVPVYTVESDGLTLQMYIEKPDS